MTPAAPDTPSPAAVTAFLRGLDRRARLFATVQAGDALAAQHALAVVGRVFSGEAGQWPIAEWPRQYWRLLLAAPSLRKPPIEVPTPQLPGIGRLPVETRAAVLLHLVAALDDADAAAALGIDIDTYQARIRDALPRDALGQPDVDVWRAWRAAAERELARAPEPASQPIAAEAGETPGSARRHDGNVGPDPTVSAVDAHHHFRLRWLCAGVALCLVAMIATFFLHPRGREVLDQWRAEIKREPLACRAAEPKARFDAADIALHPDRDLLAAPGELAFARQLPLLAWLDVASADVRAADAVRLPVMLAPSTGEAAAPADDAAATMTQRQQRWDALPTEVTRRATRRMAGLARTCRPRARAPACHRGALAAARRRGARRLACALRRIAGGCAPWLVARARTGASLAAGRAAVRVRAGSASASHCWRCCAPPTAKTSTRWSGWRRSPRRRSATRCDRTCCACPPRNGGRGCWRKCRAERPGSTSPPGWRSLAAPIAKPSRIM